MAFYQLTILTSKKRQVISGRNLVKYACICNNKISAVMLTSVGVLYPCSGACSWEGVKNSQTTLPYKYMGYGPGSFLTSHLLYMCLRV